MSYSVVSGLSTAAGLRASLRAQLLNNNRYAFVDDPLGLVVAPAWHRTALVGATWCHSAAFPASRGARGYAA